MIMENQETLTDICEELRSGEYAPLADRIEAARKREGVCRRSIKIPVEVVPTCSTAAIREALKACVAEMCDRCRELAAARGNPLPCLSGCEPVRKAKFALAKPPRNCDRFGGDIDKLREACARERGLNPEEDFPDVFPDRLLAPSTESGVRK